MVRWLSSLIVALLAACGGGGSRAPAGVARDAGADAVEVAAVDAGAPDGGTPDAAVAVDAAEAKVRDLGELRPSTHREIYTDVRTTTTWTWRGPRGAVTGVVRWIPSPSDPDDVRVDVELEGAGGATWRCAPPDCVLECEGNVSCDLGLVAHRDRLVIASMWMNKLEYLAENAVEVRWRGGALEVKDVDPCRVGRTGLWDEAC